MQLPRDPWYETVTSDELDAIKAAMLSGRVISLPIQDIATSTRMAIL